MSERRPIRSETHAGPEEHAPAPGVDADAFRDALARWASTVTVVAVRDPDDGRVHATTVTSFAPVSLEPPEVVVSLNATAKVLPFVRVGRGLGISLLGEGQRRWATVFADTYPAGPMPWAREGPPLVPDSVAMLACTVRTVHATEGDSRLVVARVEELTLGDGDRPLLYWRRAYRSLDED